MNRGACVEEVQLLHASERDQLRPTTVLPPQRLKPRSLSLSLSIIVMTFGERAASVWKTSKRIGDENWLHGSRTRSRGLEPVF